MTASAQEAISTIAAVATPLGHGAVGIIRVSGPRAKVAVLARFTSLHPKFTDFRPYHLHHGHILGEDGRILDEVLAAFMPGPGSFTGEDVVEIHCHGAPVVLQAVLESILAQGVLPAGPGEFTQRAFLNGRMDLTQAEAVAEIIAATSPSASLLAQTKLSGALSSWLHDLRSTLEELRAQLCLAVDFPEEDLECLAPEDFLRAVERIRDQIRAVLDNSRRNRIWNDGALCVLSGAVNAGKSSLLNLLLGRERAIVSATPGTTRDYLEERLFLQGLEVRLVDTAGVRQDADAVERAGLSLARELQERADVILLVMDNATQGEGLAATFQAAFPPETPSARQPAADLNQELPEPKSILEIFPVSKTLVVANKADLPPAAPEPVVALARLGYAVVHLSAKTGQGLDALQNAMRSMLTSKAPTPRPDTLTPNLRQSLALERADQELTLLRADIHADLPYDLLGVRLESVSVILAEITGEITSTDVLESIFSKFCIGK
ncbi:tRNA uridine-5-carboxymethylaminomethyl(34) synthesis GTPase MnmE [Desulfonatronum sp. SC1]|uniref:tRNA uridine-5-carboxymethylaminomethyl(34) synthesis GTPase MnmE n=1 Tax=Desulfonatronum sp. SC1 TaxID=2109626 RepID=UPI000D327972|nr:tRNA uridine-5-carboxymethylaminomethyl(34) synthesis GTPase MnmE [Desulfonatronum sp. SC1]PTN37235.1 tRNA uridine-5-carboxymethylaminomethyl(34) synthesis GTPase MnmE [Desulfonatronum sp. SC1]